MIQQTTAAPATPTAYKQRTYLVSPTGGAIGALLACFAPTTLAQMDAVALQDRVDTKYVFHQRQLLAALPALSAHYAVLEIAGLRLSPYQTLYFDTPDFALYLRHHDGWSNRYKMRSRRYLSTNRSFLELKRKTNKERTVKQRVETDAFVTALEGQLLGQLWPELHALEPKLDNSFTRITLVGRRQLERVTLDLDLRFAAGQRVRDLPGLVVAEVKQQGVDRRSPFIQQMHAAAIRPTSFSKYCVGVALLYPMLKHNVFNPQLRLVEKLLRGNHDAE